MQLRNCLRLKTESEWKGYAAQLLDRITRYETRLAEVLGVERAVVTASYEAALRDLLEKIKTEKADVLDLFQRLMVMVNAKSNSEVVLKVSELLAEVDEVRGQDVGGEIRRLLLRTGAETFGEALKIIATWEKDSTRLGHILDALNETEERENVSEWPPEDDGLPF